MNRSNQSNKSDGRKIIVVGLDGATFDLIKPWAEEGILPTFQKLLTEGAHGVLISTIPYATIPAWPSFSTGTNPGKHGFYDSFKQKVNSYDWTIEMLPSRAVKQPTLWEIMSHHNKRVAVINVPSTYPPTKVNGYIITGMLTPPGARYIYPSDFQRELRTNIGEYNVFFSYLSSRDTKAMMADLENTLESRVRAALYLWRNKHPDFMMVVDNGTDRAGHDLWRFLDPSNPLYNVKDVARYGNPLLSYYQKVDQALGRFLAVLDENTTLIVMSDHGQGSLKKFINLNLFLMEQGFIVVKRKTINKLRLFLFDHSFTPRSLYNVLEKIGVERYATDKVGKQARLSLLSKLFFSTSDIDWSKTKAFATGITGGIRINAVGREPQGIVEFGKEYEDLRDELIGKLSQLKDPVNCGKLIGKIYKREDIYHGPYLGRAPDIIATAKEGYEFFGMYSFSFDKVIEKTFGNSGSHRPNGIFMAVGKGIKKGLEIKGANIIDVTPTILHIMKVSVPINIDGRVLKEIFERDDELATREVEYQEKYHERERIKEGIKRLKK